MDQLFNKLISIKYITLNSKKEFNNIKDKFDYHLIIINDIKLIPLFIDYLDFVNEQSIKKHIYCSIDFEFNTKKIALFQLCFEIDNYDRFIFFIYPPMFTEQQRQLLISTLINIKITKILHGSDSLDLPYLFDELLKNDKLIKIFLMNFVDTKFLCEYYNVAEEKNEKCKIYELLLNKKIITQTKYDQLNVNDEKMGPIYNIVIDIHNLSHELIIYSLYDVVFLKELVVFFDKQTIGMIKEVTQFTINQQRNLLSEQDEITFIVNKLNNCFIKLNDDIVRLNEIYNLFVGFLQIEIIHNLLRINYFKKTLEMLIKYILYFNMTKSFEIYEKSNILLTNSVKKIEISQTKYPIIFNINNKINLYAVDFINYINN